MNNLPTAVQAASDAADVALEADVQALNAVPSDVSEPIPELPAGTNERRVSPMFGQTDDEVPSQTEEYVEQPVEVNGDESQTVSMTQGELREKIESSRNEIRNLFESRLKHMSQLSDENKNLRKRVSELETEMEERKAQEPVSVDRLREEYPEFDAYEDEDLITLTSLVRKSVAKEVEKALPRATQGIRDEFETSNQHARMVEFQTSVDERYPGLVEMDKQNDPEWVAFLNTTVKGTGGTVRYGDSASLAYNNADIKAFSEIVDEFARQTGHQFGSRGSANRRVRAQVRPSKALGRGQKTVSKPVFKRSDVNRFNKDYTTGELERRLSPEAIAALLADIEDAELEGRIVNG